MDLYQKVRLIQSGRWCEKGFGKIFQFKAGDFYAGPDSMALVGAGWAERVMSGEKEQVEEDYQRAPKEAGETAESQAEEEAGEESVKAVIDNIISTASSKSSAKRRVAEYMKDRFSYSVNMSSSLKAIRSDIMDMYE